MNIEQIREYHQAACNLRFPKFDPNLNPGAKIAGLEEHIINTAHHRGDLEQAIAWVLEAKHDARGQLDAVVGWEQRIPKLSDRTAERVLLEKGRINPGAVATLRSADHWLKLLERQVRRLEKDYDAASRAFTLITGQA